MSSSISESKHTLSSNKTHPRPIADECNATCDGHLYRDGRADGPTRRRSRLSCGGGFTVGPDSRVLRLRLGVPLFKIRKAWPIA
jgi:phosphoribosyl 1,2-cyclic phosphodiesterase